MSEIWLPGDSDFARAMRGWPVSPNVNPNRRLKLNSSHPLSKYFVAAGIADSAGYYDPVSQRRFEKYALSGSTGLEFSPGIGGIGYSDDNAFEQYPAFHHQLTGISGINWGNHSLFVVVTEQDSPRSERLYISAGASDAYESSISREVQDSPAYIRGVARWRTVDSSDVSRDGLTVFAVVSRADGVFVFKDGVQIGSGASVTAGTSNIDRLVMGNDWTVGGSASYMGAIYARIHAGGLLSKGLSNGDVYNLSRDFYRAFIDINDAPILISVPAAGGTPTLSSPGVINVQSDRATPQVTLTF